MLYKEQGHQNAAHAAGQGGDARHGAGDKGEQAAQASEHAYHHHKAGEEPGDAVIRGAVEGGALDAVDSPEDADLVGDDQRQHGRNNQGNNDQQGDNERGGSGAVVAVAVGVVVYFTHAGKSDDENHHHSHQKQYHAAQKHQVDDCDNLTDGQAHGGDIAALGVAAGGVKQPHAHRHQNGGDGADDSAYHRAALQGAHHGIEDIGVKAVVGAVVIQSGNHIAGAKGGQEIEQHRHRVEDGGRQELRRGTQGLHQVHRGVGREHRRAAGARGSIGDSSSAFRANHGKSLQAKNKCSSPL